MFFYINGIAGFAEDCAVPVPTVFAHAVDYVAGIALMFQSWVKC